MIESIDNSLQIVVLLICAGIAVQRSIKYRSRSWTLLFFFFGSWVLGSIYWLMCLLFYDKTPQISAVSDLSWYASLLFLYLLLSRLAPYEGLKRKRFLPWAGPVFAAAMAMFFMLRGEILSNLVYAVFMGLLMFSSVRILSDGAVHRKQHFLAIVVLVLCLLEYALLVSSCFWTSDTLANPYYWFDFLITACFPLIILATKKAVEP